MGLYWVIFSGTSTFGMRIIQYRFSHRELPNTSSVMESPRMCQHFLKKTTCKPSFPGAFKSPMEKRARLTSSAEYGWFNVSFIAWFTRGTTLSNKLGFNVSFIAQRLFVAGWPSNWRKLIPFVRASFLFIFLFNSLNYSEFFHKILMFVKCKTLLHFLNIVHTIQ